MTFSRFPIAADAFAATDFTLPPGAPTLQELLDSGEYVIAAEQRFVTIGVSGEHVIIWATEPFRTLSTDAYPNLSIGGELTGQISVTRELAVTDRSTFVGSQSGSIDMIVPVEGVHVWNTALARAGVEKMSRVASSKMCSGRVFKLKIGRPLHGYSSFHTVFTTFADRLEPTGPTTMRLTLGDYGRNLRIGICDTFAGTGGAEGNADVAGQVKRRHYGAPRNVSALLINPAIWRHAVSGRVPSVPMTACYEGAALLVEDTGGYPFANDAAFEAYSIAPGKWVQYRGDIRKAEAPLAALTVDFADAATIPEIIRTILEEAGVAPTDIVMAMEDFDYGADNSRSQQWQDFAAALQNDWPAGVYIEEQENVIDVVDRLAKAVNISHYSDRAGRICFDVLDFRLNLDAVAGTDYLLIDPAENVRLEQLALPSSVWPPNWREYLLADKNHTSLTGTQVLPTADDAQRQYVASLGIALYEPDVTPGTSPLLAGLPNAVDPPLLETGLVNPDHVRALGRWLGQKSALAAAPDTGFLRKRPLYRMRVPLSLLYQQPFLSNVKYLSTGILPDDQFSLAAQLQPPTEDWRAGMMEFDCWSVLENYYGSFKGTYGNMDVGRRVVVHANHLYATSGGDSVRVYDVSAPMAPVFVTEFQGPSPGVSLAGAWAMLVVGSHLYVICGARIAVLSLASPAAPAWVTDISGPSPGTSLAGAAYMHLNGSSLYVACQTRASVAVLNVGAPASPSWVTEVRGPSPGSSLNAACCIQQSGNALYVLHGAGIAVLNVVSPTVPSWLNSVGTTYQYDWCIVCGGYLYLSRISGAGIAIYELPAPTTTFMPLYLRTFQGPEYGVSLQSVIVMLTRGSNLYCLCFDAARVAIIDISNPRDPAWVTEVRGPSPGTSLASPRDAAINGEVLYVARNDSTLALLV